MASGSSGARSSITGRAASSPRGRRSRTRWSSSAPARGASRTRARPRSSSTTASTRVSQNRWPTLRHDLLAVNQLVSPFLGAGFYYKTFMWPASFWEKLYEPAIRRAAGLGRAAGAPDPDHYEKAHAFCDVLVIGGGPAGLAAALAAGRAGARVILCDEDFRLGGRLLAERRTVDGEPGAEWAAAAEAELAALPNVRIMRRTTVFGVYDGGTYGALERVNDHVPVPPEHEPRQRTWKIVAKRAVLAAGSIERGIVFGGNDRPGVMLAGAVRTYLNRFAAAPGRRAVVFANNDEAGATIADLRAAGDRGGRRRRHARGGAGGDARGGEGCGCAPCRRRGRAGGAGRAECAQCPDPERRWTRYSCRLRPRRRVRRLDADDPPHLPSRRPAGVERRGRRSSPRNAAAGDVGRRRRGRVLRPRRVPRRRNAGGRGRGGGARVHGSVSGAPPKADDESTGFAPFWHVKDSVGKAFVDLQNDVTTSDVKLAAREGFRIAEHLKRYTTLGMATDQGKTSNAAGMAVLAAATERTVAEVGMTTFRPPFSPVAIGAFAGHHRGKDFRPTRLTPSHSFAEERGAVFVETGNWLRAQWFPEPGETDWLRVGDARGQGDARAGRGLRRLDPRQDRRAGAGRRRVPRPGLCQHLLDAAGRQGALRTDAPRGRLRARRRHHRASRRRPLLHDHDHGQRGQGHAAPRILPPVHLARARRADGVGHRAVGAIRHRRTACAGSGERAGRPGRGRVERGLPLSRRRLRSRSAAGSVGGSTGSPSRASSPTSWACPRASATR